MRMSHLFLRYLSFLAACVPSGPSADFQEDHELLWKQTSHILSLASHHIEGILTFWSCKMRINMEAKCVKTFNTRYRPSEHILLVLGSDENPR